MFGRPRLQVPGEHFGIEQIPVGVGANPGADLRPRNDQRLGAEPAVGFPQRGAGDGKARAHFRCARQQRPGRIDPGDDVPAKPARELAMKVAFEPRIVAAGPHAATGDHARRGRSAPGCRAARGFGDPLHGFFATQAVSRSLKELTRDLCMTMKRKRRIPPLIMIHAPFSDPLKLISVAINPRIMPTNSVPATIPTPPVSKVPPRTTDAIALSSFPVPASG